MNAVSIARLGRLGYGAAALGNLYSSMDDADADGTLQAAWSGGIRYYDTAPHYGLGLSERRLGSFLSSKPRDQFVVSTKVGRLLVPNPQYRPGDRDTEGFDVDAHLVRRWEYSEAGIRLSLEQSLERLGLDRVDILFLHDPEVHGLEAALAAALPALERIRSEGLVSTIGIGTNSAEAASTLVAHADLDLIMLAGRYSLLEQPALEKLFPVCLDRGTQVVAAGVFNSGILASHTVPETANYNYRPAPPKLLDRARRLAAACERHGVKLPDAAVQFPLRHPAVANVVVGARGAAQISANVARMGTAIPAALWDELADAGLIPQ